MSDVYLKPDEVAALLRVCPWTVLAWRRRGWLRGVKIGQVIRFSETEVNALIEASTEPAPGRPRPADVPSP